MSLGKKVKDGMLHKAQVQCTPDSGVSRRGQEESCVEVFDNVRYAIDKEKCKNFAVDCPKKSRETCIKTMATPPCTTVEAPYPAFSDCRVVFPKLCETECTKQDRLHKKIKIVYPSLKDKKGDSGSSNNNNNNNGRCGNRNFSTSCSFHTIRRFYSNNSSSNNNRPKNLLEMLNFNAKVTQRNDDNDVALKILEAVERGLKLLSKNNKITRDNYLKIYKELELLSLTRSRAEIVNDEIYLMERDSLINVLPAVTHNTEPQSTSTEDEVCKTIAAYNDYSILNYEQSGTFNPLMDCNCLYYVKNILSEVFLLKSLAF